MAIPRKTLGRVGKMRHLSVNMELTVPLAGGDYFGILCIPNDQEFLQAIRRRYAYRAMPSILKIRWIGSSPRRETLSRCCGRGYYVRCP